ncbi:F-box/LRR-repeat protein At2g43260-like [Lolium rigidum]|uniref:F-box/LRR-repeat protein At2g43260-like n=1 Tax=Lolium rigidum TaxID=89674 RepID=UPI001F5DD776|nr:F-box/LRR-repeat protein At2g43260-like [Lolium rigidum]
MPDSSGATVFDDLPEWLVVDEILFRLPPKDVLRCRAVRRSWRSGTSTDKFILDHHRRQPSLPIIRHREGLCRFPVLSGAAADVCSDKKIRPFVRYTPTTIVDVIHHGACDGLLILSEQGDFYICNPTTRRCASLPHPPLRPGFSTVTVVAFYRHHTSGEHRVLWVVMSHARVEFESPDYFVLTVGSDKPRFIQWPIGSPAAESSTFPPVHHRGSLHWPMGLSITVFDTVAETFRQMSRPAQLGDNDMVALLDMGGALALSSTTPECVTLDVWVLQDYDAETWGFQYRINLRAIVAAPPLDLRLKYVPSMVAINERELLIQVGWRLLHCGIDGTFLGNVEIEEHENYLTLTKHRLQESMISLPLFERQQQEEAVNNVPPFLIVL